MRDCPGGALKLRFKALVTSRSKPKVRHLRGSRAIRVVSGQTGLGTWGLTITLEDNGATLLTGSVVDQPASHGLLKEVLDLGMPLVSVNHVKPGQADVSDIKQTAPTKSKHIGGIS